MTCETIIILLSYESSDSWFNALNLSCFYSESCKVLLYVIIYNIYSVFSEEDLDL